MTQRPAGVVTLQQLNDCRTMACCCHQVFSHQVSIYGCHLKAGLPNISHVSKDALRALRRASERGEESAIATGWRRI